MIMKTHQSKLIILQIILLIVIILLAIFFIKTHQQNHDQIPNPPTNLQDQSTTHALSFYNQPSAILTIVKFLEITNHKLPDIDKKILLLEHLTPSYQEKITELDYDNLLKTLLIPQRFDQGYSITDIVYTESKIQAHAKVTLKDTKTPYIRNFSLIKDDSGWKIDQISIFEE